MEKRINIGGQDPAAYQAMLALEKYLSKTALTHTHQDLIKIRASQINGCAYCINMHTREARRHGETEQRIYLLNAWRETELYSSEEQAILALTEEITLITGKVSDETYQKAAALFTGQYLTQLIMAIITINAWNRIGITTQMALD